MIDHYQPQYYHYLILSAALFVIGLSALFFRKKNVLNILMSIELMLLSVNINFIVFATIKEDVAGYIFSICVLAIAAAETAVGFAILVSYFKHSSSICIENIKED